MRKSLAVLLAAGLVASALMAPPAEAKKKEKKKKKPPACAPYVPGEQGTDQPLVMLTDAATVEAPVEQAVSHDLSTADFTPTDPSVAFFNVQVDSALPEVGVHALFEFDSRRDYDLYLRYPDGAEAASAHGFNTAIEVPIVQNTDGNHAGESTAASEHIIGVKTADCGGWTIETQNWLGEGGDFTVKLWLTAPENDPLPPA